MKKQPPEKKLTKREKKDEEENLTYPASEDIYNVEQEETEIDTDDLSKRKSPNIKPDKKNEKEFEEAVSGSDLDIPGSETDEERINGEEDEENDYYSQGQ